MLERFMEGIAKELQLDRPLEPSAPGVFVLPLDAMAVIEVSLLQRNYLLRSAVAPCPKQQQEEFYTQMLLANLFGQGTAGATLGLSSDGETIILSHLLSGDIDYREFRDAVEDFMNSVDFWRSEGLNYH